MDANRIGSLASMCPASHEGVLVKLLHRGPLLSEHDLVLIQGGALVCCRASPANLTSGGTASPPRSRIRDGRAPRERHHSLRRHSRARPDNGDAPLDSRARAAVAAQTQPERSITPLISSRHPPAALLALQTATARLEDAAPGPPPSPCACAVPCQRCARETN
jgi:hypothetical protein